MKPKPNSGFGDLVPVFAAVCLPVFVVLGIVGFVRLRCNIPINYFTRDTAAVLNGPFYAGAVSNLGILLWCATASFYFLTARLLWEQKELPRFFLVYSLAFNLLLLFDDLFMFHEEVMPKYLHFPEVFFYGLYAAGMLFYLVRFRKEILDSDFPLLAAALALFACSVLADEMSERPGCGSLYVLEDGAKFLGIALWCAYAYRTCRSLISERIDKQKKHEDAAR